MPHLFAAIILAAGHGSRLAPHTGVPKPLTMLGEQTFLARIVATYRDAGVAHILVVTGASAAAVAAQATALGGAVVAHPAFEAGMLSSVVAGVRAVRPDTAAAFVHPVDLPLVRPGTIGRMLRAWQARPHAARYLVPRFAGKNGHPPLLGRDHLLALPGWQGQGGLAGYAREQASIEHLAVADGGILHDVDTPEDLALAATLWRRRAIPTEAEAEALLAVEQPDARVVAHCRAVAVAAQRLAAGLQSQGMGLDPHTAWAAGLLHDIAKGRPSHAATGAEMVREAGFEALAPAIAVHPQSPVDPEGPVGLPQVLALADKYCEGDAFVPVTERFASKRRRFMAKRDATTTLQDRETVAAAIELLDARLQGALTLEVRVAVALGRPPFEVVIKES